MAIEIKEYLDSDCESPYAKRFEALDARAAAKIISAIDRVLERPQVSQASRRSVMALTRNFKETVRARAQNDPSFRLALIEEAIESLLDGDLDSGKSILSNYINATIGYQTLAERTGRSAKSLMRMLGPAGNPTATNLFEIIGTVKEQEHIEFDIRVRRA